MDQDFEKLTRRHKKGIGLQKSQTFMKNSLKIIFFFSLYTLMCSSVLLIATRESTIQPIGLLVIAMVMTPIIVSIFGGMPLDVIKKTFYKRQDD